MVRASILVVDYVDNVKCVNELLSCAVSDSADKLIYTKAKPSLRVEDVGGELLLVIGDTSSWVYLVSGF